ncbi:choice-of-anchor H family protein [Lacimicrobium alkaliphilum]|uniref:GlyGly-CTERM sorting domain-containing protein n=1 Tax=Lacimicrobium alkaliphilum TaxID=1526571 RepID=A0ABQ1RII5_9ALTE|nr:choice-of-anchor H family protein [Lacimicrobium alkaliphilum]GGD71634.1 hypothetical protein GCM10011357_28340 [Lacimicrobium alkaliphilum]
MKSIIFISLMTLSTIGQAQTWKADSAEYQSQQKLNNTTASNTSQRNSLAADSKAKSTTSRPEYHGTEDIWIYDAWVTLELDEDHDGYYSGFTVSFDADTYYNSAAVYAVLYLGVDEEFREYHDSSMFTLYGEDSNDVFEVETTLVEGFVSDDYEILIEVYDADTSTLMAVYDGYSDDDLVYIPLESRDYEYTESQVVINHGGGSYSFATIASLMLLAGYRRIRSSS